MQNRKYILRFIILVIFIILLVQGKVLANEDIGKYLVVHLDGISSKLFFNELEAGRLTGLEKNFAGGNMIEHGITYFPPFTQVVVTRVRDAKGIADGQIVDWDRYDEETDTGKRKLSVYRTMRSTISRRAKSNFIYGYPVLSNLGTVALLNIPELIDKYGVVEFYWFNTDTYGHIWGEEVQLKKLMQFDKYFGQMAENLGDDVNLILYSDHGMTFGEGISFEGQLEEIIGDSLLNYSYPNIYIENNSDKEKIADQIVNKTPLDYVFYQQDARQIIGYNRDSRVIFEVKDDKIKYLYDEKDTFAYYKAGYQGQFLTEEEWLDFSHDLDYPFVPVRIYELFQNPNVGDMITVLNAKKFMTGGYVKSGNHQGLSAQEMTVPILVKGPDVEHLYDKEYLRLDRLFSEIPNIEFNDIEPARNRHSFGFWLDMASEDQTGLRFNYSPDYRWKLNGDLSKEYNYHVRTMYDVYSGYISRIWLGVGFLKKEVVAELKYKLRLKDLGMEYRLNTGGNSETNLFYRANRNIDIKLHDLKSLGIRYRW